MTEGEKDSDSLAARGLLAGWFGVVPVYIAGSAGVLIVAALLTQTALYRDRVMGFRAS